MWKYDERNANLEFPAIFKQKSNGGYTSPTSATIVVHIGDTFIDTQCIVISSDNLSRSLLTVHLIVYSQDEMNNFFYYWLFYFNKIII